jgi:hypothetical protein
MGCGASTAPVSDAGAKKATTEDFQSGGSSKKGSNRQNITNSANDKQANNGGIAEKQDTKKMDPPARDGAGKYVKITNKQCSMIRLDTSSSVKKINNISGEVYDFSIQYCYVSQKGYYPNALGKANQDSYLVCESLLGERSSNLFGIFDGHGEYGDYCSYYSADQFPEQLISELKSNGGLSSLDGPKMNDVYTRAYLNTNFGLHASNVDDTLSGTTGVTILQRGDKLLVANVGDSRAIIASEVDGKLKYSPLSVDQTPYRKDERERLKRAGARIMTMDQIEGNEPIHENFGTDLGEEIDEVSHIPPSSLCILIYLSLFVYKYRVEILLVSGTVAWRSQVVLSLVLLEMR